MRDPVFAEVILDRGVQHTLDYAVPDGADAKVGMRVLVPVKGRLRKGIILKIKNKSECVYIKKIGSFVDSNGPLLHCELLGLAYLMSKYYGSSIGKVIHTMVPKFDWDSSKSVYDRLIVVPILKEVELVTLIDQMFSKCPARARILRSLLRYPSGVSLASLLEESKSAISSLKPLERDGAIKILEDEGHCDGGLMEMVPTQPKNLNCEQMEAVSSVVGSFGSFRTHLIHGVTGSGKTEVYMQIISQARKRGMGVIFLVPEITLTSQTVDRISARFPEKIGVIHSKLSKRERAFTWNGIRSGEISIVIGARSAVFSPVKNLGLVIVDEEHDTSYKQCEEEPCYNARDVAIMRGSLSNVTVVLGSATPSIESYFNGVSGKYSLKTLSSRPGNIGFPVVKVVDMARGCESSNILCSNLVDGIRDRLDKGEQVVLLVNRRGYHTFQMCSHCKKVLKCRHCSVNLTYHKMGGPEAVLSCHLCGYKELPRKVCQDCSMESVLLKGVGSERVESVLHALFPGIRTLRMDADTTKTKGSHDLIFKSFKAGKADILVGTQMIAKGFDFPSVTLVGILNADSELHMPDFRSTEYLYQLIVQASGRSGRYFLGGEVIIQSGIPTHPVFKFLYNENFRSFFESELAVRKELGFPPFSRIAKVVFSGYNEDKTLQSAVDFYKGVLVKFTEQYVIYPPIACGYSKIRDKFRFKVLIKGPNSTSISSVIRLQLSNATHHKDIKTLVDVDTVSML